MDMIGHSTCCWYLRVLVGCCSLQPMMGGSQSIVYSKGELKQESDVKMQEL